MRADLTRRGFAGTGLRFVVLGTAFTAPVGVFPDRPLAVAGYLLLIAAGALAAGRFRAVAARRTGAAFAGLAVGMALLAVPWVVPAAAGGAELVHVAGLVVLAPCVALLNVGLTDVAAYRWPGLRPLLVFQALLAVGNGVPPIALGLGAAPGPPLLLGAVAALAAVPGAFRRFVAPATAGASGAPAAASAVPVDGLAVPAGGPPAGLAARLAAGAGLATAVQLGLVFGATLTVPAHADQVLLGAGLGMVAGRVAASLRPTAVHRRGMVLLCLLGTAGVAVLPLMTYPVAVTLVAIVATAAVAPAFPALLGFSLAPHGATGLGPSALIAASTGVAAVTPGALQLAHDWAPGSHHWVLPAAGLLLTRLVSTLPWPPRSAQPIGASHRGQTHVA